MPRGKKSRDKYPCNMYKLDYRNRRRAPREAKPAITDSSSHTRLRNCREKCTYLKVSHACVCSDGKRTPRSLRAVLSLSNPTSGAEDRFKWTTRVRTQLNTINTTKQTRSSARGKESQNSMYESFANPKVSSAGFTAFSIIAGGPHISTCASLEAAGRCFSSILASTNPVEPSHSSSASSTV